MSLPLDTYDAAALPAPVIDYLDARDDRRGEDAVATFARDAVVIDDGGTHEGVEAISRWIGATSSEFTYTVTRLGQVIEDPARPVVQIRIDGNFPGGTALLHYRFELEDGLISRLSIGG